MWAAAHLPAMVVKRPSGTNDSPCLIYQQKRMPRLVHRTRTTLHDNTTLRRLLFVLQRLSLSLTARESNGMIDDR